MAEVLGARLTDNVNQSTRKIDMVPTIKELEPDATPLTVLSTRMPSAPTGNPEFSWVEDDLEPRFDAVPTLPTLPTAVMDEVRRRVNMSELATKGDVEYVYISSPAGAYTVTVKATNVAAVGVPWNADLYDQVFALVC